MPLLHPREILSGFRIEEFVAAGATSEVYRARSLDNGSIVAAKILQPIWGSTDAVRVRFENEGKTLIGLQHPHIIRALAIGTGPQALPFIALEWAPSDLEKLLQPGAAALATETALRVAAELSDGLVFMHARGLVHRDLKPANILLTSSTLAEAAVRLADLGLAKSLPGEAQDVLSSLDLGRISTAQGIRLGTWEYMAPELWINAKSANPKSDVYALGCLLFHLLTQRPPFAGSDERVLMFQHLFEPPPLHTLAKNIPAELHGLLAAMLSKKTEGRPTVAEVRQQLGNIRCKSSVVSPCTRFP